MLRTFALWTLPVLTVDVRPWGVCGTDIGFSALNTRFHALTGVHMSVYTATDWLGLVPVFVCLLLGGLGFRQLCRRRSLKLVDRDILLLGAYYAVVVLMYLTFEAFPVNYRPILIDGRMEASYPSSTTLLVLSVMPTLAFQAGRRLRSRKRIRLVRGCTGIFTFLTVFGRTVCGVHRLTDIVGSVLLSSGLFLCYLASVRMLRP